MHRVLLVCMSVLACAAGGHAVEWQAQRVDTPARVTALETVDGTVRINAGGLWYEVSLAGDKAALKFIEPPAKAELPDGALPDGRVAFGTRDIARAWLAQPTARYDHGTLSDSIEAGSLVIETRSGRRQEIKLDDDAVFEDLEPRLADIDGDGRDDVVVVKSSLKRGSNLAVIGERRGRYQIVAETPPLGQPRRWLNPAGIGDFTGDGKKSIAFVRQPHTAGMLELWTWSNGGLHKTGEIADTANHIAGSRVLNMAVAGDFDGDGIADIAIPSLDRSRLRIVSFAPQPREIANAVLPAKAATNVGLIRNGGVLAVALGLNDGSLVLLRRPAQ